MRHRSSIGAAAVTAALLMTSLAAQAFDDAKYPDLAGQWVAIRLGVRGHPAFDPTKPWGFGQQAPLTPEYRKVLEDSMADQAIGGLGNFPTAWGRAAGMPYMMMAFGPLEWVITPKTTYILIAWHDHLRRVFTDGRDWPEKIEPSFAGYSMGRWIEGAGGGVYDVLGVETRGLRGPRAVDEPGLPMHVNNNPILKGRFSRD